MKTITLTVDRSAIRVRKNLPSALVAQRVHRDMRVYNRKSVRRDACKFGW